MSMFMQKLSQDDGFSLVETLLAVFLLSVISLITLNIMSNFADANQRLSIQVAKLEMIDGARNYLRDDMRQVIGRPFIATDNLRGSPIRLLRFTRSGSIIAKSDETRSSVETIEYWFDNNNLVRRIYDRPETTDDTTYIEYTILTHLSDLSFKYYDGTIWYNDWKFDPSSVPQRLPKAIEMAWVLSDENSQYTALFPVGPYL